MPAGRISARLLLAGQIARKALWSAFGQGAPVAAARRALAESIFLELACRNFGAASMVRDPGGFYPHIFMPRYRGPHFDEALRRVTLPGLGPNVLYFSLTGACPCHCEYCFANAGGGRAQDVGDQPILRVARTVADLRVPLVNISGGEPLTRFRRLLRAVELLQQGSEVRLFTTGVGLTRQRLRELRQAGLSGVFVSLDGENQAEFDRARGLQGAHDAAVAALRLCADEDMLTFINSVVAPGRFPDRDSVARFLRFVAAIDPRIVVNFLPQLATGRGAHVDGFGGPDECEAVAARIVATAQAVRRPVTMLFGRVDRFIGCPGAGGKLMNVDVAGNVTVCVSRASLGNLLDEPFAQIYRRYVEHCRRLKVGFFCCEVARDQDGALLEPEHTRRALDDFYRGHEDALWQGTVDRFGWLFRRLLR